MGNTSSTLSLRIASFLPCVFGNQLWLARYAQQRQCTSITVVFFVEAVDDENRTRYKTLYQDGSTGVTVEPVLVTTVE